MPDPRTVYVEELSSLFNGRAVLNPRRTKLKSGRGLRTPIDVGDVVYDYEGKLTRLFNCLKSETEQDEDSVLPEDYETLMITSPYSGGSDCDTRQITVETRETHAGPYFSKGVRRVGVDVGASVASVAGSNIAFSALHKQGAVLITSGDITTKVSPNRPAFEQYMVKHFDMWCSLLNSMQLDVKPEGLMFVTAVDYTSTWSNLVYMEHQLEGNFSVDVPSISTVGGTLSINMELRHEQSGKRDWGPNSNELEFAIDPNSSDSTHDALACTVLRCIDSIKARPAIDQTIFIRGLRGKKRLFRGFRKLVGEGEPRDLDDDDPSDGANDSSPLLESLGKPLGREDYLTPALDHILKTTDVDMAIVHDEDFQCFLEQSSSPSPTISNMIHIKTSANGTAYGTFSDSLPKSPSAIPPTKIDAPRETDTSTKVSVEPPMYSPNVVLSSMSPGSPSFYPNDGNDAVHSAPARRRRSLSDPFRAMLQPPVDEKPAERHRRLEGEHRAKQVSDSIDQQLEAEHQERKRNKVDVKVLLLGQSESGKSTTLKQFQLAYTPAAFRAERMAWRPVIYLNLVMYAPELTRHRSILDAISPDLDEPVVVPQTALTDTSFAQPSAGVVLSDTEIAQKHARYAERLAALLDLEERLITMLAEDDEEEATRLGDGSSPGWSHGSYTGRPSLSVETRIPAAQGTRSPGSSSLHRSHGEVAVRTTSNWKKALSLSRVKLRSAAPDQSGGEVVGWWEDPSDPVHVLGQCSRDMSALWADPWVRTRLAARRIRLEESSGFYLNDIDRITAKKYLPTDDDVLKARLKTMGVVEQTFNVSTGPKAPKPMVWKIFDVGGARNQRQAWAPYFTDANAIIFLAPISAYDQVLAEDPQVNRLEDSLLLWRSVVSNKLLQHVNLIIFLNKCDLLKAKLESGVRLNQYLLTYGERPNDYDSVSRYLRNKFGLLHSQYTPNPNRELFIHFTAVTDTRRTSTIIANVRDIIVRKSLKDSKLLV